HTSVPENQLLPSHATGNENDEIRYRLRSQKFYHLMKQYQIIAYWIIRCFIPNAPANGALCRFLNSLVALTSFFSVVFSFSVLAPPALVREDDRQTAILRSQRAPIVTAIAVVRGQPPFNYNLPKNTPFRKREKEKDGACPWLCNNREIRGRKWRRKKFRAEEYVLPHVRFKGLTKEAKLSRSLSLSVFRVVFEISERVVASIREDHRAMIMLPRKAERAVF
ncbi:hypothetical protein ALC56_00539, partial [Trachymyrmex septentrionalis]